MYYIHMNMFLLNAPFYFLSYGALLFLFSLLSRSSTNSLIQSNFINGCVSSKDTCSHMVKNCEAQKCT